MDQLSAFLGLDHGGGIRGLQGYYTTLGCDTATAKNNQASLKLARSSPVRDQ